LKFKTLKWIVSLPLSLAIAHLLKEALFLVFDSRNFSSSFFVWLFTSFIFMITLVSVAPHHKSKCVKYSFYIILLYSLGFILLLFSIWEFNGSFNTVHFSISLGCAAGSTLTFLLLRNEYIDNDYSPKLIESDQNFFFDIIPIKEQQELKDQAQRELMAEYEAQGVEEYEISDSVVNARAIFIFENREMIDQDTLKEMKYKPQKKKLTEVETAEAMQRIAKRMQEDPEFKKRVEATAANNKKKPSSRNTSS
tara:strand:- start:12297 stop:13049 length:753 start_codon:yes stop_codon:yes gene_type:complete